RRLADLELHGGRQTRRCGAEQRQRLHPAREVGVGEDGDDTGHRPGGVGADADDARVSVGRAQEGGLQQAGQRHVVHEAGLAAQEARVLDAADGGAEILGAHSVGPARGQRCVSRVGRIQSSHGAAAAMNRPGSATPLMMPRIVRNAREIAVTARSSSTVIYSTSTIISISTGICIGSEPMPTAERACLPIVSPKTSTMSSQKPFMTFGCSPKSSVALTMPSTFTTRLTLSRLPTCARIVASRLSPTSRATCAPCSVERSLPTLPRESGLPSRIGPWPDRKSRLPT